MTGSEPTTMLVVAEEFPVAWADADAPLELPPELLHAAVNTARERALTTMRVSLPARICLMTLLISMISCDSWRAS